VSSFEVADTYFYLAEHYSQSTFEDQQMPQQTFHFEDASRETVVVDQGSNDPTFMAARTFDVNLAQWLERPILAGTVNWQIGQPFPPIYFNPWSVYLDQPSVVQKLNNFKFLKCKMNMKVTINGSQMHYGRGMLSYRPFLSEPGERFQYDPAASFTPFDIVETSTGTLSPPVPTTGYTFNAATSKINESPESRCKIIQSQWPHIFIDPGQSAGGCMQFPFIFQGNYFDLNKRDWVMNNTRYQGIDGSRSNVTEWPQALPGQQELPYFNFTAAPNDTTGEPGTFVTHMGVVHSSSFADLKVAQGVGSAVADDVTIQIFLWASDVELAVPTSVVMDEQPAILAQSRVKSYPPPPPLFNRVEAPSRAEVRTEYVPDYMGETATPTSDDTYMKRTTFGPALLSGDSATAGCTDADDMSMSQFATREAWFTSFTWSPFNEANRALFQMKVTPQLFAGGLYIQGIGDNVRDCVQTHLPCSYCALPFAAWRGSMRYRFQIVASNFHRGRLRIVYDPEYDALLTDGIVSFVGGQLNTQYQRVVDIGSDDGRDFAIDIRYMQTRPFLPLKRSQSISFPVGFPQPLNEVIYQGTENGGSPLTSPLPPDSACNGAFTVYVMNELVVNTVSTAIPNDIVVNVFASAGPDLEFQNPTDANLALLSFQTPTGFPPNFSAETIPRTLGEIGVDNRKLVTHGPEHRTEAGGEDQAALGAGDSENVPTDPPVTVEVGETLVPVTPVFYGESFKSFTPLMDRWNHYNTERFPAKFADASAFTSISSVIDESVFERVVPKVAGFQHNLIIPDFPPYPGPAPQTSAWRSYTEKSVDLKINDTDTSVFYPTVYPGLFGKSPTPPSKYVLDGPFSTSWPGPTETSGGSFTDYTPLNVTHLLRVNPGTMTMMHFVSKMFLGRKGSIRNKYIVTGTAKDTQGQNPLMVVKRLPPSNMSVPMEPVDVTASMTSWSDGAMNPDDYVSNYRWPVSGGKWNQAYFVRPILTDNSSWWGRQVVNAEGDNTVLRPDWTVAGGVPAAAVQNALVQSSNLFYAQMLHSCNSLDQSVSAGNIVPTQLSCNNWPYVNRFGTDTLPVPPTKRKPENDPGFEQTSRLLNLTSHTDNLFPGAEATVVVRQPVLEVEIPFYENTRFVVVNNTTNNTTNVSAHALSVLQERERTPNGTNLPDPTVPPNYNSNASQLETAATIERWVKPGADFALFYLLNAPTIYYNDKFVLRETIPTYAGDESAGWTAGDPRPYSDLQYAYANRSESSLPGYRMVTLFDPGAGEDYQPAAMYVNVDPALPYFTNVAPEQATSYYRPTVPSSII